MRNITNSPDWRKEKLELLEKMEEKRQDIEVTTFKIVHRSEFMLDSVKKLILAYLQTKRIEAKSFLSLAYFCDTLEECYQCYSGYLGKSQIIYSWSADNCVLVDKYWEENSPYMTGYNFPLERL